ATTLPARSPHDALPGSAPIVGAGPSLGANVADLRRLGDRGVIIAADTAVRPLVTAGVPPHIAVAADSSELNARHLTTADGVDDRSEEHTSELQSRENLV